jgi:hypothetical protein
MVEESLLQDGLSELARLSTPKGRAMDHPARTGLIGAGLALGRSFQPNLLTRGTTDQALISGVTTAMAYGLFSTGDAIVDSLAARITGDSDPGAAPRVAVAAGVGALGLATFLGFHWKEHESRPRAAIRLAGRMTVTGALASAASSLTSSKSPGRRLGVAVAVAATAASWAGTRPWGAAPGSLIRQQSPGGKTPGQEQFFEDSVREVAPVKMAAIGAGIAVATYGLARGESILTGAMSRVASATFGGQPQDHRTLGRITAFGISAGVAYALLNRASAMLTKGGGAVEPGMEIPPSIPGGNGLCGNRGWTG